MAASRYAATGVLVEFDSPEEFYEIPLHLPPDALDSQITDLARKIWPGGTDFQRNATAACYREIAESLHDDGVLHSALGLFSTEDGRVSTANLITRIEETEPCDPDVACGALHEMLSMEPHRDVHKVDLKCGPAVVSFHAVEFESKDQLSSGLAFAHIELYVPSPIGGYLLVFSLSTPSIADLPVYTSLMAQIGDTVSFSRSPEPALTPAESDETSHGRSVDDEIRSVFG
ncbi:hypothetical protein [Streptomyces sp. enrichment culture]|uniref:hypothetical protein n=1 Tax=Streptomyces sp. enrichment culture TaxID=1795815 RepID=UPI003F57A0DF